MKTMRKLYNHTMEELEGVIMYSKCAIIHSNESELHKLYLGLAKDEMEHAKQLHAMSRQLFSEKIGTEDIDPRLMELWEEMESCKLEKMGLAKACLDNASA